MIESKRGGTQQGGEGGASWLLEASPAVWGIAVASGREGGIDDAVASPPRITSLLSEATYTHLLSSLCVCVFDLSRAVRKHPRVREAAGRHHTHTAAVTWLCGSAFQDHLSKIKTERVVLAKAEEDLPG